MNELEKNKRKDLFKNFKYFSFIVSFKMNASLRGKYLPNMNSILTIRPCNFIFAYIMQNFGSKKHNLHEALVWGISQLKSLLMTQQHILNFDRSSEFSLILRLVYALNLNGSTCSRDVGLHKCFTPMMYFCMDGRAEWISKVLSCSCGARDYVLYDMTCSQNVKLYPERGCLKN